MPSCTNHELPALADREMRSTLSVFASFLTLIVGFLEQEVERQDSAPVVLSAQQFCVAK
jgi:hypothetical protein